MVNADFRQGPRQARREKAPALFTSSRRAVRRYPRTATLSQSALIVKRLSRSPVRSRNQVALMSHSADAYELAPS